MEDSCSGFSGLETWRCWRRFKFLFSARHPQWWKSLGVEDDAETEVGAAQGAVGDPLAAQGITPGF